MSSAYRTNRKATDADILKLNSIGISLGTIARILGVHPTTVTLRLKSLNVAPSDTRRTFMEDILNSLSPAHMDWLAAQLNPELPVKEYVKNLLLLDYKAKQK